MVQEDGATCSLPLFHDQFVVLGHGSGGRLTNSLIENVFLPLLGNQHLRAAEDAADVAQLTGRCVISTDSYVVQPIVFPGGNIGSLAVNGTVNDLAMRAARPLYLTAGFILEEGLSIETLRQIVSSLAATAQAAAVPVVAADTKVVNRGAGDQIFINTTGIGELLQDPPPGVSRVRVGDAIIASGDIGRHGIAIMCQRSGLQLESTVASDCSSLFPLVQSMLPTADLHCLRDLTRGGLATVLNEIACAADVGIEISEKSVPVSEAVRAACELLGLDPLYVACEGRLIAIISEDQADSVLETMRRHGGCPDAGIIGRVTAEHPRRVVMQSVIGGRRIVDRLSGEQLPRIC